MFYESPHRVREMLEDCAAVLGAERSATLAREITKLHETDLPRLASQELAQRARGRKPTVARGEIVLVVAGAAQAAAADERGADGHGGALDRVLAPCWRSCR